MFVPDHGDWRLALVAADDSGEQYYGITETAVSGPAGQDIVLAFRDTGSGADLDVDVVSGPMVVAHRGGYDSGWMTVAAGRLDLYGRVGRPGEGHAGWSLLQHDVLRWEQQGWVLASSTTGPTATPPVPMFPPITFGATP